MKKELLQPKQDIVFKKIFGSQHNTDILSGFLKTVLLPADRDFSTLTIVDPHLNPDYPEGKLSILDVKAVTGSGKVIDVEVQVLKHPEMLARILAYMAKMVADQLNAGEGYTLKKCIGVYILDYVMFPDPATYHKTFHIDELHDHTPFGDLFEIHVLELPRLPAERDGSPLWNWLRFFKVTREEELDMLAKEDETIEKAASTLMELSQDERMRLLAESRDKAIRDEYSRRRAAEKEGLAKGMEKGLEKGLAKGKKEASLSAAKNALKLGLTAEQAAEISGLSLAEVLELKE